MLKVVEVVPSTDCVTVIACLFNRILGLKNKSFLTSSSQCAQQIAYAALNANAPLLSLRSEISWRAWPEHRPDSKALVGTF